MTKHTSKELLGSYVNGAPVWGPEGRLFSFSVTTNQGLCSNVRKMLSNPEQFTLTDPNKPTPKVGDSLTLEQLHDVEFMRGVSRVKISTPHSRDTHRLVKSYSWGGGDIQNIEYAITHADVGWKVTVAEVVE